MSRLAAWAYRRLDESRLLTLLGIFLAVVLAFGLFYAFMTPYGNGISQGEVNPVEFNLLDGLYFSVVTVSSLGYGDMQPVGYSKVAATIEVLIGLGFIGIMIAKLTSRPIAHLVSRVFVSTTRERLVEFAESFRAVGGTFWSIAIDVVDLYPSTPGQIQPSARAKTRTLEEFREGIEGLQSVCRELQDYIDAESAESLFFRLVPKSSLLKLAVVVQDAFEALGQLISGLPTRSHPEIFSELLTPSNMKRISRIKAIQDSICAEFMREDRYGDEAAEAFRAVKSACDRVPDDSIVPPEFNRPDQILGSNELPTTV